MDELSRQEEWKSATSRNFDLAIIGGGIMGTGIARDAAMRGLKVALFEKEDFGHGTTAAATRLIHGGLRYLEMYDFKLVREDLREREILLRIAPHLVFPLSFILPLYDRGFIYRNKLRIGMILYDLLSYDKSLPNHTFLSRAETVRRLPGIAVDKLQGAAMYYDATAPLTERLCVENVISAKENGAVVLNHAKVVGLLRSNSSINGVRVLDLLDGREYEVTSRLVINASGPWLNQVASDLGLGDDIIRTTKGVHLVTPKISEDAAVLFARSDQRLFFVVPWLKFSYIGTTDTDYKGDMDEVTATEEDVDYLLSEVKRAFPGQSFDTIYYTTAGVRSLAKIEGVPESKVTRKHIILDHYKRDGIKGIISLIGGKLTAYRGISKDVVDLACEQLGVKIPSRTAAVPLPGGYTGKFSDYLLNQLAGSADRYPLDAEQIEHMIRLYGSRYKEVAAVTIEDPDLSSRLHPDYPDTRADVKHAVTKEYACTLADYMLRRSDIGFSEDRGEKAASAVGAEMAALLNWTKDRQAQEVEGYLAFVRNSRLSIPSGTF